MAGSNMRPLIPALAASIQAALFNAGNRGVGQQPSDGKTNAVFVNTSAFLRMRQACSAIVQAALAAQGWGPYYAATILSYAVSMLKLRQQSRGDDVQFATLLNKKDVDTIAGWHVPAAFLAPFNAAMTILLNTVATQAIAQADAIQNSAPTDVANVAAAQLIVSQGNI